MPRGATATGRRGQIMPLGRSTRLSGRHGFCFPLSKGSVAVNQGGDIAKWSWRSWTDLPMTSEAYIAAAPPVSAPTPTRDVAPAAVVRPRSDGEPRPGVTATTPASTTSPAFPVSLQFDPETHRFLIEARDSSGLVVFQVPFKPAAASSSGAGSSSETRGQRVNSKA